MSILGYARRAMTFFPLATPEQRRSQAAKYAKAVCYLGSEWLHIKQVSRLEKPL